MAGLINSAMMGASQPGAPTAGASMAADATEDAQEPANAPGNSAQAQAVEKQFAGQNITPELVRSKMQIPPSLQNAYARIVAAGMKVIYSKDTHQMAMQALQQGSGSIDDRIGIAVAGLMGLLFQQSNGTLPPQLIIPAGLELVVDVADFLRESKQAQVTNQDIAEAMGVFVDSVLAAAHLNKGDAEDASENEAAPGDQQEDASEPPEPGAAGDAEDASENEAAPGDQQEDASEPPEPDTAGQGLLNRAMQGR